MGVVNRRDGPCPLNCTKIYAISKDMFLRIRPIGIIFRRGVVSCGGAVGIFHTLTTSIISIGDRSGWWWCIVGYFKNWTGCCDTMLPRSYYKTIRRAIGTGISTINYIMPFTKCELCDTTFYDPRLPSSIKIEF
jgi:hypothetical protein